MITKRENWERNRYIYDGNPVLQLSEIQLRAKKAVEDKISSGIYQFEEYCCECGADSESFESIASKDRYGLHVETVICNKCGLMMTNPRMTQKSYNLFYDDDYRELYGGSSLATNDFFNEQIYHGRIIMDYVLKFVNINKISNVLEIGCGAGGILYPFKEKGLDVTGVDLGSEYLKFGREKGLNLINCSAAELLSQDKKYDLIILSHVLEHFIDLKSELSIIFNLLNPTGLLYVEVPGIKWIKKTYDSDCLLYLQNAHIRHFTLGTLSQVLQWNHFKLIDGSEEIKSLFSPETSVQNIELINYYPEVMEVLRETEVYRTSISLKINKYLHDLHYTIASIAKGYPIIYRYLKRIYDKIHNYN